MATTITHITGTITPHAVEGYRASREARTVTQPVLNLANPDITLREFGLRTGQVHLVFDGEAAALSAYTALSVPQSLAIDNPDIAALRMTFVIADGDLEIEQDRTTTGLWRIIVPFQEVTP